MVCLSSSCAVSAPVRPTFSTSVGPWAFLHSLLRAYAARINRSAQQATRTACHGLLCPLRSISSLKPTCGLTPLKETQMPQRKQHAHHKGLDLILSAAKAHGENSEPDHEVGDLQAVLRAAWEIMTPGQRAALLSDPRVAEQLESELPEGDDGTPGNERIEAALRIELDAANAGASLYDLLVAAHPGFLDDTEVDGAELVNWVIENMAQLKATKPAEHTDSYVELVVTMRSNTTFGKDTTTIRVFAGQSAAEVAAETAQGYGSTVVSIANMDGTPFISKDAAKTNKLQAIIKEAREALLNVPQVGEVYDQQHSDTHQRAYLRLEDAILGTDYF